jgi:hypothetical protein
MFAEIKVAFPKTKFIDRTTMNTWEDQAVIDGECTRAQSLRQIE